MTIESIDNIIKPLLLEDETYTKIGRLLEQEMAKGLSKTTNPSAKVKMLPTYVRALPNGLEEGNFLALDLGGTNFRVLLISLSKESGVRMENKIYPVPEKIMTGTGKELFDHIAYCISDFIHEHNIQGQHLPLGFTFSFPCKQESLSVGRLISWTKGFSCSDVEGENVVDLLHAAIKRRNDISVECVAILNDTVGCLMSCAYLDHDAEIGVILGTGTNACYMEKLDKVELWDQDKAEPSQVVINTEWGAFGDDGCLDFIRTDYDFQIDERSLNRGRQLFEKMISGMYMGEIVRLVVVECVRTSLMFSGVLGRFKERDCFKTKYVSAVEKDHGRGSFENTKRIIEQMGIKEFTDSDCSALFRICQAVSIRAAKLSSAAIVTLMNRINRPNITVAVDGSLFRFHPRFEGVMKETIAEMYNFGHQFKLMLSEDGSGKGAALVAAVAHRLKNN